MTRPANPEAAAAVETLEAATNELIECIQEEALAREHRDRCKTALEAHRAFLIVQGVDGKNQPERDARLALLLEEQTDAVADAEADLTRAAASLRVAQAQHQLARYRVRAAIAWAPQ